MSKYEIMRKERRGEISDAAKALICRKGFGDATMKEISEIVGISRNTLYKYYPNMDTLAYEVAGSIMNKIKQTFIAAPLPEGDSVEVINHIVSGFFDYAENNSEDILYISLFDAHCSFKENDDDALYAEYKKGLNSAKQLSIDMFILSGQQDGTIRNDVSMEEIRAIISHTVMGAAQRFTLLNNKEKMVPAVDRIAVKEFLLKSIENYLKKGIK
jgi:AcrR family transcriptional regulator